MYKRLAGCLLLANMTLAILVPTMLSTPPQDEAPWWNDELFRKEIIIPVDTSSEHAHYQPVDIYMEFDDPCWVKNEEEHSVRVIFQEGARFIELDSQIYDLSFSDEEHIESCGLVFLIPEEANGNERYFIYYDDVKTSGPNYPNHVDVDESYYEYEQIPGLPFESEFYQITEEGFIVYAINKKGMAIDTPISQQVAKLKKGTEEVMPKNGEIGASFEFVYWWLEDGEWRKAVRSSERLVKHQIFVDGNLMVKFAIVSESTNGLFKTTVIYKYYYCPTEDKRIYTHVKHEVIDYPLPMGDEIDVAFVTLTSARIKSSTIDDLNFGVIPPYLHFYSDEERIREENIDQYPERGVFQPLVRKKDDCDLGSSTWLSFDEGKSGKAHAIIFESNNIIKNGTDERDGIQLLMYESSELQYPGLDSCFVYLHAMRNTNEEGAEPDEVVPEDYVIEFNAEFFTSEDGGYPTVEEEAKMYQKLIQYQPIHDDNVTDDVEDAEKFNLTAYVHLVPSFPLGSLISTGLGLNVSYLTAEVYKENSYTYSSSGTVGRLPLIVENVPPDFEKMTLVEIIKILPGLFDWENLSFFKKVCFSEEEGRYLIKIFREKSAFEKERQFIGYTIVELDEDIVTHIYCKPEGKVSLSILNQDNSGMKNAKVHLKKDDMIIAKSESDSNGNAIIKAPCGISETYTLNITYKGFLINDEQIRLGRIRRLFPLKKTFNFDVYDLDINVRDFSGKVPTFDVDLSLTSDEMVDPITINVDNESDGVYKFNDLYPASYILKMSYSSFEITEKIEIPEIESLSIKLYDFTAYIKDSWNLSPGAPLDVILTSKDFEKTVVMLGERLSFEEYHFSNLYPGNYTLKIRYKSHKIEELISIPDRENINVIFPAVFNVTATIFDSHGNPLKGAKVLMIREEKGNQKDAQGTSNDNGEVIFSLPPGNYVSKIFSDGELVAKRKVEILNKKSFTVVTTDEPLLPYLIIGFTTILLIGVAVIGYRRKNAMFFLKILAVSLVAIAIVSPWWAIQGSSSDSQLDTSTNLFMVPTKMVTITSSNNVLSGELPQLDDTLKREIDLLFTTVVVEFLFVMELLTSIMIIGIIFVIASLILDRYSKKRLSFLVFLLTILIFVGSIVVFSYAMSELANQTVGSFIGGGNLDVNIPGEKLYETISCSWGPSIGFYLLLCSIAILIFVSYSDFRTIILKILKKIKRKK